MPNIDFSRNHFVNAEVPIRPNGTNNSYGCFNGLKKRYGVYVFHGRDDRIVRYVGSAGTIGNLNRDVSARLKQHYTRSKTGATFYRKWLAAEHPCAPRDEGHLFAQHAEFLAQFGRWSLDTVTIADHSAVELVPAVEHALIHALRPKYNGHLEDAGEMPAQLSARVTWCAGRTVVEVCSGRDFRTLGAGL